MFLKELQGLATQIKETSPEKLLLGLDFSINDVFSSAGMPPVRSLAEVHLKVNNRRLSIIGMNAFTFSIFQTVEYDKLLEFYRTPEDCQQSMSLPEPAIPRDFPSVEDYRRAMGFS